MIVDEGDGEAEGEAVFEEEEVPEGVAVCEGD